MCLDIDRFPFLYSANTTLAYKIAKRYYGNIHYVWCTTSFNSMSQPPTSNPATICKRYFEQAVHGDRHTQEIHNNMVGILVGAKAKLDACIIGKKDYNDIRKIVSMAEYKDFLPILYVIDSRKVKDRCIEVEKTAKANDSSIEYRIEDLTEDEFEKILFFDVIGDLVHVSDEKVGC